MHDSGDSYHLTSVVVVGGDIRLKSVKDRMPNSTAFMTFASHAEIRASTYLHYTILLAFSKLEALSGL